MKKKACESNSSGSNSNGGEALKQKERHIVSWSQEEDDILREQIGFHGTDNWAIIASKFKDKTTRQCRRRWFTYLNSDFKRGGWSHEEDMLLCEAQKIFGNRWTEIAKVVSGRTDNAVKNRFSTLCKKRARQEASTKENNTSYIKSDADGSLETVTPPMKMRKRIMGTREDCNLGGLTEDCRVVYHQLRNPFAILLKNFDNTNPLTTLHASNKVPEDVTSGNIAEGTILKKDDPKITALLQQAELLSSLAPKANTEKMDESLENAWKAVQDFVKHTNESEVIGFNSYEMDHELDNFKYLVEDIRSCNESSQQSWRQPDLYQGSQSPVSSEYSTGSTVLSSVCPLSNSEFNSPLQVTPLFTSMAARIPSPQFSESERHFLLKTLGMESTTTTSQPPPCKRALLQF